MNVQRRAGDNLQLNTDIKNCDLSGLVTILVNLVDTPLFRNEFDFERKDSKLTNQVIQRFRNNLHDIKNLRNRFSHSEEINAREMYEGINNIQKFFESFAPNRPNSISMHRESYIQHLDRQRLLALENLVEEETLLQIKRCLGQQK